MSLIGKEVKSLKAVKGLNADQITAEHLDAITAELKDEFGIEGIEVAKAGTTAKAAEDLKNSGSQLTKANDDLKTANEKLAKAEADLKAANEKLAALPAGKTEEPKAEKDAIKETSSEDIDYDKQISDQIRSERRI